MNRSGNRQVFAFTLIELMLALALCGLFMVMVTFKLDGLTSQSRLNAAGREIAKAVLLARSEAATKGAQHAVLYNLDENWYRVLLPSSFGLLNSSPEDTAKALSKSYLPKGVSLKKIIVGSSEIREEGSATITVSSRGFVTPHEVLLVNERKSEILLKFNSVTGKASFQFINPPS